MKRPAAQSTSRIFRSHLFRCLCKGNLAEAHKVDATLYGMSGPEKVSVATARCTSYSCRRTYGPNFYIEQSAKINTLPDVDVAGEAVFLSPKIGFTVNYLRYHMLLEFRAFASARAALDVYSRVYDIEHCSGVHGSAIMYFIALSEYPAASIPMTFAIGHEVTRPPVNRLKPTIATCTTMRSLRLTSGRSSRRLCATAMLRCM